MINKIVLILQVVIIAIWIIIISWLVMVKEEIRSFEEHMNIQNENLKDRIYRKIWKEVKENN